MSGNHALFCEAAASRRGLAQTFSLYRTGIAAQGELVRCRWIAVRHIDEGSHIVALAPQDGSAARVTNDSRRVREACLDAGAVTARRRRAAATHNTQAEG